jgi:hypothetical protein
MKVKIKGMDNIHNVIAWSSETRTIEESWSKMLSSKEFKVIPVAIIQIKNTKELKVVSVYDIESIES